MSCHRRVTIAMKDTTAEAWEAINNMRVGSESVRNAKAHRLRRELESIGFRDGEAVDDFCLRVSNLVAALTTIDELIPEQTVVKKLLRVVPKSLAQVAVAIEVTIDLGKLTLEDVGGRLRTADDHTAEDEALFVRTASCSRRQSSGRRTSNSSRAMTAMEAERVDG
jgi:hypothetical protein